eukprot:m.63916 g.63916  ORF g.63916 m.63916 type:complete len:742 (+) comp13984_c0_seq1:142-2367(+)
MAARASGIIEDPRGFPTWYHGPLSRKQAEDMLESNGLINGQFLMRCSSKGDAYVLSACSGDTIDHYQIREYTDSAGAPYLQFETVNGPSPKFGSLSSVLHYLLQHPEHLPAPLKAWIERPDESAYDQPNPPKPDGDWVYDSVPPPVPERPALADDTPVSYEEPVLGSASLKSNSLQVTLSLATLVRDTLASSTTDDINDEELLEEHLYETVQRHPSGLADAPEVMIHSEYEVFATDAATGEQVPVYQETALKLITIDKDEKGMEVVVCVDTAGRRLIFPLDSTVEVVPSSLVRLSSARAPPLPDRPPPFASATSAGPARIPTSRVAARPGRKPSRQASLADLVKDAGGKIALTPATTNHPNVFYRDVLREGFLSKLPPQNNRVQAWKRRWFKLVISLNRSLAGGPVFLEYYSSHKAATPKGVIDLDTVLRVGRPPSNVLDSLKAYRSVPKDAVFEVELPRRTYRMLASSKQEANDWCQVILDVLGSDDDGSATAPTSPSDGATEHVYNGIVLNQEVNNVDGRVIIASDRLTLADPKTSEIVTVWEYRYLKSYGYIRNVCWFEAGKASPSGPGIFCFSCPSAKAMFETIHELVKPMARGRSRHRHSRAINMSWTSLEEDQKDPPELPARPKAVDKDVFGLSLPAVDLEPVALAVPLLDYTAKSDREYSLQVGDSVPILGTRAFVDQGFWLGQRVGQEDFGLVAMDMVQIHEHEFGNLRDMDDIAGSQDSLDDLDQDMFALAS